ncbi:MAG: siderophore-interacting protein [Acidimicrobiales bacterium]
MTTPSNRPADPPAPHWGAVVSVERRSPSMVRIVLGGEGLDAFEPSAFTDSYVNCLFLPDDSPLVVPFTAEQGKALDPAQRPKPRRFTVRHWDAEQRQLTLDFVAHGDVGWAGRWAQRATVGDRLQMLGPGGGYRPDPEAAWYLFVGDESALPAIAASLEAVPADAAVEVLVVVDGPDNEQPLPAIPGATVQWLRRSTAALPEALLVDAVADLEWRDGTPDVFVHGEAGEVRAVRKLLLADRGVQKEAASISPYWRRDHDDEAWRHVKRAWLAEQEADV